MTAARRAALFFDRDGVINADEGYVGTPDRFRLLPGAAAGVRAANEAGALAFLVTNQSGVARGFYSEDDVRALHAHMAGLLARDGARFDDLRYCPHLPDAPLAAYRLRCACRKPGPGMVLSLLAAWPEADPARSALIGDKPSDVEAAEAAGIRGVLYRGGPLAEAVRAALAELTRG